MRVAVTGGTGFVGPAIVRELLSAGHEVVLLEHHRPADVPDHPHLHRAKGDVTDRLSLEKAFAGCQAVIHLVAILHETPKKGITFERIHIDGTRNVVEAATGLNVHRFLLMSANGVGDLSMPKTEYYRTKAEMERMVASAPFEWTIFRPGYVAAASPGGFDAQFADIVDKFPVLPSFAGGHFEIQPIARENVAQAFVRALDRPHARGQSYTLVGPERMTWNEYLRRLARLRHKKRALAPVPRGSILFAARHLGFAFPVKVSVDELRMLMAGNVGDASEAVKDLDLRLIPWEDAVAGLRRK